MKRLSHFSTLVAFILVQGFALKAFSAKRPVDEKAKQQLAKLGTSEKIRTVGRFLLTPIYGSIPKEVRMAQDEIIKLVQEMGGSDLQNFEDYWTVRIYSESTPNAWVKKLAKDEVDLIFQAKSPLYRHGDKVIPGEDKLVFEIAVSTGLLNLLENKDQLAFVIGHELTHLLEEHTRHRNLKSDQQQEMVADAKSIERMVGKYELSEAASAMTLVLRDNDPNRESTSCLYDAVVAGLGSHHQEGQRISAIQFMTEQIRRSSEAAAPRALTPMPDFMKLKTKMGRTEEDSKQFLEWTKFYRTVIREIFLQDKVYPSLLNDRQSTPGVQQPSTYAVASKNQQIEFVLGVIRDLESAQVSKTVKVNSLLQGLSLPVRTGSYHLSLKDFDTGSLRVITQFLYKNSVGTDAWKYDSYAVIHQQMTAKSQMLLSRLFLPTLEGQSVLSNLMKLSPEWNRLFVGLLDVSRFRDASGSLDKWTLDDKVSQLISLNGPLAEPARKVFFENMKSLSWPSPADHAAMIEKVDNLKNGQSSEVALRVHTLGQALRVNQPSVIDEALAQIEQKVAARISFHEKVKQVIELNRFTRFDQYSDAHIKTLQNIVLQLSRSTDPVSDEQLIMLPKAVVLASFRLLADGGISKEDRRKVFEFIVVYQHLEKDYTIDFEPEIERSLNVYISSLKRDEAMALITQPPRLINKWQKVYEQLGAQAKDSNDLYELIEKKTGGYSAFLSFERLQIQAHLNALRLFNYQGRLSGLLQKANSEELQLILTALEKSRQASLRLYALGLGRKIEKLPHNLDLKHRDSSAALLSVFAKNLSAVPSLESFVSWMARIRALTGEQITFSPQDRIVVDAFLQDRFSRLPQSKKFELLHEPMIEKLLSTKTVANVLVQQAVVESRGDKSTKGLSKVVSALVQNEKLRDRPDIYSHFRNAVAEKWNLQPYSVLQVFPNDDRSVTQQTASAQYQVRGLSGLLGASRGQSAEAQLQLIEYLMGRAQTWPAFVTDLEEEIIKKDTQRGVSFITPLKEARDDLQIRSEIERSAIVNSFLTGPTGLLSNSKNLDKVVDRILSAVSTQNRDFARIMLNALIKAEGSNKSVFLSYILAQRAQSGQLDEALVLKSFLDAYGVPGVKLAQYLSFTDEFKSFKNSLESYQDAAMPLSYFEMLELVQERLGPDWDPSRFRILKILGTGSVNVAIEYVDLKTKRRDVMNISRKDIETKTREDFRRIGLLLEALSSDPTHGKRFDFVMGLIQLIQDSVTLEFDKRHAFEIQQEVQALYNRDVDGWKVRTVQAYDVVGMTIFMQKAPGEGARHVLKNNPELYRSAMGALLKVEDSILRGVGADNSPLPIPLHANPDVHDGQVLIDVKNRIVTLLDFGQAERITNAERYFGIEILRFISGVDSPKAAKKTLEARFKQLAKRADVSIPLELLENVLKRKDRMDRFVRLISELNRRGLKVPNPTIHWVLAANREVKLGQKINIPVETSYRNLLLTTKLGFSLETYNRAKNAVYPLPVGPGTGSAGAVSCQKVLLGR